MSVLLETVLLLSIRTPVELQAPGSSTGPACVCPSSFKVRPTRWRRAPAARAQKLERNTEKGLSERNAARLLIQTEQERKDVSVSTVRFN